MVGAWGVEVWRGVCCVVALVGGGARMRVLAQTSPPPKHTHGGLVLAWLSA